MSWFGIQVKHFKSMVVLSLVMLTQPEQTYNGSECIYQVHHLPGKNYIYQQRNLLDAKGHMAICCPCPKSHTGLVKHHQRRQVLLVRAHVLC